MISNMLVGNVVTRAGRPARLVTGLIKDRCFLGQRHFNNGVGIYSVIPSRSKEYFTANNISRLSYTYTSPYHGFHTGVSEMTRGPSGEIHLEYLENKSAVDITWDNGERSRFHSIWLRFNCHCPKCTASTGSNWIYPIQDVPLELTINDIEISEDGSVKVTWNEDDHVGCLTTQYMREHCYTKENIQRIRDRAAITFHTDLSIDKVSWTDAQHSDEAFYDWMTIINKKGICLLSDVPTEDNYLTNVLLRIGNMTGTCDGVVWDIVANQNPIHPAFSSNKMAHHMDLAVYESQPGIQFLHCFKFDEAITGGEILLIDMFHVAEEFRKTNPKDFQVLLTTPYTFKQIQFEREKPIHMIHRRPIFAVNDVDQIIRVSWHPMEQGPPLVQEDKMEDFYRACQLFAKFIDNFPFQRSFRYKPGDMLCFNNRRLAHGRNKYDLKCGGTRHLQGSYVNVEDFMSTMIVLATKLGKTPPESAMGNSDWTR